MKAALGRLLSWSTVMAPGLPKEDRSIGFHIELVPNQRSGIGGNSQSCLYAAAVPKTLKERWYICEACGLPVAWGPVSQSLSVADKRRTTAVPGAAFVVGQRLN